MKKLFFLIAFAISVNSLTAQNHSGKMLRGKVSVAKMEKNGSISLLMNNDDLAERWMACMNISRHLEMDKIKRDQFQTFKVELNNEGVYQIVTGNSTGTFKSAIAIVLVNGMFYEKLVFAGDKVAHGLMTSCFGCPKGCNPVNTKDEKGICTGGCGENCKKESTLFPGPVLYKGSK